MKNHDGAITVSSQPGHGSVLQCYFPAAAAPAPVVPPAPPPQAVRGHGQQVLYVDDEAQLVFLVTRLLQRLGYQVTGCTDAMQALHKFQAQPHAFDVVISDLTMPGMSGFEFAQACLQIRPDLRMILTSGYIRPEDSAAAQRLGIGDVLFKPTAVDELAQVLHQIISAPQGAGEHDTDS
jgi:CheY-like chemotaxis protein